jgi:hypothetical protein
LVLVGSGEVVRGEWGVFFEKIFVVCKKSEGFAYRKNIWWEGREFLAGAAFLDMAE